jgi:hypothetical protein
MDNDISIGHTKSPELIVELLNFYFKIQNFGAIAHYREHGMTKRIFVLFEKEEDAEQFTSMHKNDYKYFVEIVFRYIIDALYGIGRSKKIESNVNSSITPETMAKQLLDVCKFKNGTPDEKA